MIRGEGWTPATVHGDALQVEEARRSRQTETARADAADARNAVLAADNDELRAETRSCQEQLLQALSLLEEYQEEMSFVALS